jgi:folate-binding protein YgfZ
MPDLPLRELHQAKGASFTEINGAGAVASYGQLQQEYHALTQSVALVDFSFRGRLCLLGADRIKFLHGQVTNDLNGLAVGEGCYAALVNPKAKMEADLYIYRLQDELLLDFEPGLTQQISSRLEKYIIADDVQVVDVAPHYLLFTLQGPQAPQVLNHLHWPLPPKQLSFLKHETTESGELYLVNNPRLRSFGVDLFVPIDKAATIFDLLDHAVAVLGGRVVGLEAFETVRIETGIPRFGVDLDNTILPPEAGLEKGAISYSKGCYIGQEIIARIRTYGQVAKSLRRLIIKSLPGAFPEQGTTLAGQLPERGTRLFASGKEVGYLTSACVSPKEGAIVALGYVRREVKGEGATVHLGTADGPVAAVFTLPQ